MRIVGNRSSDNEVTIKRYVDDKLDENTILRFTQTLDNYLKLSVGNDIYNLTKKTECRLEI